MGELKIFPRGRAREAPYRRGLYLARGAPGFIQYYATTMAERGRAGQDALADNSLRPRGTRTRSPLLSLICAPAYLRASLVSRVFTHYTDMYTDCAFVFLSPLDANYLSLVAEGGLWVRAGVGVGGLCLIGGGLLTQIIRGRVYARNAIARGFDIVRVAAGARGYAFPGGGGKKFSDVCRDLHC